MDGQLYWATGKHGDELDLAGLVCNHFVADHQPCANPKRGQTGGMTWEQRQWEIRQKERHVEVVLEEWEWSKRRFDEDQAA